ncbi:ABC-type branched-chain amino acid transport system, substrate-binding protein [Sphingobium faniae]|nr:ABC-type branched-chain amino acid transport system, substrate-binding protein [Sphingobium faniae]
MSCTPTPYRISIYHNWALQLQLMKDWEDGARLAFEEAHAQGVIDRPVELLSRDVWGAPNGSALEVRNAMRAIVHDDRVHGMIGLAMTEDAAIIREEIGKDMQLPVLSFAATTGFDGHYCFQTPCGTHVDEAAVMAAYVKASGHDRMAMMHDTSFQGEDFGQALREFAASFDLSIVSSIGVNSVAPEDQILERLEAARDSGADAFAYVGVGMQFKRIASAMRRMNWEPGLKICGLTFVGAHPGFDGPEPFEGWVGLDQFHEENDVMQAMATAFQARFDRDGANMWTAHGYDEGRLMAMALGRAGAATRAAIRDALETIRMVPAAVGGPGNMMSFGPHDHRAYKGDYFVIRRIVEGRNELVGAPSAFFASL